jgi:hypothetical protein
MVRGLVTAEMLVLATVRATVRASVPATPRASASLRRRLAMAPGVSWGRSR